MHFLSLRPVDAQGFTLSGNVQGQESACYPRESGRLSTDAGTFNKSLNFLLPNSVTTGPILRLSN